MLSASASKPNVALRILAVCALCGCHGNKRHDGSDAGGARAPENAVRQLPADLQGTVMDSRKVPLPDVLVIAWPKGKRGDAVAHARTDGDGRFILPNLRPDRWKLLVEAGGLGTLETERQVPEDGPAVLMLAGQSRVLSGIVTDAAGRPEAGADVALGSPGLRWMRTARSDANGNFVMPGLGSGRFTLRARFGQRVSQAQAVVLDDWTLRPTHVRLTLQPGVIVEGSVLDDTGRALAGADVDLVALPSDDLPVSGQSSRDGRFRLDSVAPGKYQILARLEGHVALDAPEPELGPRASARFDLRLARTAKVAGQILDESGRPMAGVQVSAISLVGGKDDVVVVPGALPLAAEAAELPTENLLRPGGVRSNATDRTGRFLITGLSPGRARIEVRYADKLPLRREPVLLAPGDTRDVGALTLLSGATVTGKVLEGDAGVEGALVEARPAGKPTHAAVRATADATGEFFLRLPRGDYWLTAETQDLVSGQPVAIAVRSDIAPDRCTLQVGPRPARELKAKRP